MDEHRIPGSKITTTNAHILIVLGLLTILLAPPPVRAAIEVGTAVNVVNKVYAKTPNRQLNLGDGVVFRETVSTGEESAVDIKLVGDSKLIMGELSEMLLDRMVYDPNRGIVEGALDVVKGVFRFSTSGVKMDISINTPVASIGVRGTEFDVLATATTMEVAVHEGTVEVASAAGVVSVSRGQVYSVTPAGIGFADQASPEMQAAVTTMLSLVASRGDSGQASSQTAAGTQASP
jgi:hypothetical protein